MADRKTVSRRFASDRLAISGGSARLGVVAADPRDSRAGQLADALSALSPELQRWGNLRFQQEAREDRQAGEQFAREALQEEKRTWDQLVAAGEVPTDRTPFFEVGLREQMGRNAASRYQEALRQEYLDNLQHSTDPNAFDEAESRVRSSVLQEVLGESNRDPFFEAAFGRAADEIRDSMLGTFQSRVSSNRMEYMIAGVRSDVMTALRSASPENRVQIIQDYIADADIVGIPREAVNDAVTQAVVDFAEMSLDPSILDWNDPNSLVNQVKLGNTAMANRPSMVGADGGLLRGAISRINALINDRNVYEAQNQEAATREILDTTARSIAEAQDPSTLDFSAEIAALAAHGEPGRRAIEELTRFQNNLAEYKAQDSIEELTIWYTGVDQGTVNRAGLLKAVNDRELSLASYSNLLSRLEDREDRLRRIAQEGERMEWERVQQVTQHPAWQTAESFLTGVFDDPLRMANLAQFRGRAIWEFERAAASYLFGEGSYPGVTFEEQSIALQRIAQEIADKYQTPGSRLIRSNNNTLGQATFPIEVNWRSASVITFDEARLIERHIASGPLLRNPADLQSIARLLDTFGIPPEEEQEFLRTQYQLKSSLGGPTSPGITPPAGTTP